MSYFPCVCVCVCVFSSGTHVFLFTVYCQEGFVDHFQYIGTGVMIFSLRLVNTSWNKLSLRPDQECSLSTPDIQCCLLKFCLLFMKVSLIILLDPSVFNFQV